MCSTGKGVESMSKVTRPNKPIRVDKYARVSSVALRDQRLTTRDKMVYVALCDHMDITGRCWPSVTTICALSGLGKTAVHQGLYVLESLGYIERIQRHATSNLYRVYELPMGDLVDAYRDDYESSPNGDQSSPGEHTEGSPRVYVEFDERSGLLREAEGGCSPGEHKEEQEREQIKKTWEEALPGHPLGTRNELDDKIFTYFLRREGITIRIVEDIIAMVRRSTFLQGYNQNRWKPSMMWCLKNREKVLSGKYSNFENKAGDIVITM